MKKLIAFMLAALMLVVAVLLTACGNQTDPTNTPKATEGEKTSTDAPTPADAQGTTSGNVEPTEPSTPTTEPTEPATPTTEPTEPATPTTEPTQGGQGGYDNPTEKPKGHLDANFGGRTFTIVTTVDMADDVGRWNTAREYYVETRTGNPVDIAVYDRNAVMKRLYNCDIKIVEDSVSALIKNDILTSANTVDFGTGNNNSGFFGTNTNGYYVNAYDLDLDFDLPGWNKTFFEQTTMRDNNGKDKLYTVDGDFNLSSYRATYVLFCNLDLYNQNFSEPIFDIVNRGEWTIDKMIEMVSQVRQNTGEEDWKIGEDTFGLLAMTHEPFALIMSTGIRFVTPDENHNFTTSVEQITGGNNINAIAKAAELYATDGVETGSYTVIGGELKAARTLFMGECLDQLERISDDENLNVTVVPQPLYEADSSCDYKFYVNSKASCFFISANACGGDMKMVAEFLNVLTYHSNKIVLPEFIKTWGGIYCQDEQAVDMLAYIMNGRQYDYAYYKNGNGAVYGQASGFITDNKAKNFQRAASGWVGDIENDLATTLLNMTNSK